MVPMGELGRVYEDCVPPIIFMLTPGVQYTTGNLILGGFLESSEIKLFQKNIRPNFGRLRWFEFV